jgi:hypothetical protein
MRQHIGYFTLGGLKWNCFIDNFKMEASGNMFRLHKPQLTLNIASR